MKFNPRYSRLIFYSLWLLLGLLQASATQLIDDETYYWVYSRFPAAGYFDHPPMIAILIKAGYWLFHNETGVRLLCVLLNTMTILITEKLLTRPNLPLFYTIVISIAMLQLGGILAVPDSPLLFFTALFFYAFKKYTANINTKNALLIGSVIALMFYTKYHGLLVVLFAFMSAPTLFKRKETWIAAVIAFILYIPHLLWQWENNWISFRYHLFESNVSAYRLSNTLEYVGGQILLAGPLTGILLLPAVFLHRSHNALERALKFTLVGIYLLFLISSFRGKVEMNWTMPVLIPLIVLSHGYIDTHTKWLKPLKALAFISLILIIAARIYMIVDLGPDNPVKKRFHYNKEWVQQLDEKTGDVPVVFYNSYQRASMFWFYSGKPSHSLNDYRERVNNYSFWPVSEWYLGKAVYLADIYDMNNFTDSIKVKKWMVGWKKEPVFASLEKLRIVPDKKKIKNTSKELLSIGFHTEYTRSVHSFISSNPNLNISIWVGIFKNKECLKQVALQYDALTLLQNNKFTFPLSLEAIPNGKYHIRFGIQSNDLPPVHNGSRIDLHIR